MEFSIIKKEEIPMIKQMVASANCLRVIFFAPALTIYILTEFFSDWKIMHSPAYKHYLFKFFGFVHCVTQAPAHMTYFPLLMNCTFSEGDEQRANPS